MVDVKKINMSYEKPYFGQQFFFSFLHSPNDKSIFHGKTLAQVACEDAHVNFFL
jgi:hypothetical protein